MNVMKERYEEFLKETVNRIKNATSEDEKDFYRLLAGKLLADAKKQGIELSL